MPYQSSPYAREGLLAGVPTGERYAKSAMAASDAANDAFDIGTDSYSPVSLAHVDRASFAFND